jgi:hypothetical protein
LPVDFQVATPVHVFFREVASVTDMGRLTQVSGGDGCDAAERSGKSYIAPAWNESERGKEKRITSRSV